MTVLNWSHAGFKIRSSLSSPTVAWRVYATRIGGVARGVARLLAGAGAGGAGAGLAGATGAGVGVVAMTTSRPG